MKSSTPTYIQIGDGEPVKEPGKLADHLKARAKKIASYSTALPSYRRARK